jgi:hypothetical protein
MASPALMPMRDGCMLRGHFCVEAASCIFLLFPVKGNLHDRLPKSRVLWVCLPGNFQLARGPVVWPAMRFLQYLSKRKGNLHEMQWRCCTCAVWKCVQCTNTSSEVWFDGFSLKVIVTWQADPIMVAGARLAWKLLWKCHHSSDCPLFAASLSCRT